MEILRKDPFKKGESDVAETLKVLSKQLEESYSQASRIKWRRQRQPKNLAVAGMGGSNLAFEMIRSALNEQLKVPIALVRNYNLPNFVNKETLAIISSYSGNTEETLSCFKQAIAKKAEVFVLSSGGKAISMAKKKKIGFFQISLKYNPSKQPRFGIGSQLGALLAILKKAEIISNPGIKQCIQNAKESESMFGLDSPKGKNPAKLLAIAAKNRLPIIVGSEFLSANARILNNQINESSKNLAFFYHLPEINHHLLDGLKHPKQIVGKLEFIFLESDLFTEKIKKRIKITKKILEKQKINFVSYRTEAKTKLAAAIEALIMGSYLSFYLSGLNKEDPAKTEWVDYLKKKLAE